MALLTGPMSNLRALIANCAAWQEWTETASADEAAERIHYIAPTDPEGRAYTRDEIKRPYIVIDIGPGWSLERIGSGAANYRNAGRLRFRLEDEAEPDVGESVSELTFVESLEALLEQMATKDEGLGYLVPTRMDMPQEIRRSSHASRASEGDYFMAEVFVEWRGT